MIQEVFFNVICFSSTGVVTGLLYRGRPHYEVGNVTPLSHTGSVNYDYYTELVLASREDAAGWFLQEQYPEKLYIYELLSGGVRGELQEPAGEDWITCIFSQ